MREATSGTPQNMKGAAYTLRMTGQEFAEIPSIEIPAEEQIIFDERGWPTFSIKTDSGPITCRPTWWNIECSGSAEALTSYGLFCQEWMPGLPGNNKVRQSVVFTESGPALAVGRFARNQHSTPTKYLVVIRKGSRAVVELPITPEQKEWFRSILNKRRESPPPDPAPQRQSNNVIQITSRPRLETGDYAYIHEPGTKHDGMVVMIGNELCSEKGKYSVSSLGMPFVFDGEVSFQASAPLNSLRRISRSFFEARPFFNVG